MKSNADPQGSRKFCCLLVHNHCLEITCVSNHTNAQFAEGYLEITILSPRVQTLSSDCGSGCGVYVTSGSFEGLGVGFSTFLHNVTAPNAAPIQTGWTGLISGSWGHFYH